MLALLLLLQAIPAGEEPVDPYMVSDANAGARPFANGAMLAAFGGKGGIDRLVADFVKLNLADPRIGDIFKGQDLVRLHRTLNEQFCYILAGDCSYTGRDMKTAHKELGVQGKDMNALVENLQTAMQRARVPFTAQNAFLSKLAPMRGAVVTR